MKNKYLLRFLIIALSFFSCNPEEDETQNNDEIPQYAMTSKINGTTFEANNPFGTNEHSGSNIWNYFPLEDYVMLQGRKGLMEEINIWLKKSDITVGTFEIGQETFQTPPSHFIDFNDNSNDIFENTKEGTIVITEVDESHNIVKGTFQFTTVDDLTDPSAPIDFRITDGTFRYKYQ